MTPSATIGITTVAALCLFAPVWAVTQGSPQNKPADPATELPAFRVEDARFYLQQIASRIDSYGLKPADAAMLRARILDHLGEKDKAEKLAQDALTREPDRLDVRSFLAGLWIQQDRMDEAAACLRQALEKQPALASEHRRLGMVLDRLGKPEQAGQAYARAVQLAPEDSTARLLLGRWLLNHGQAGAALDQLQRSVELDPTQAGAYYALHQTHDQLGQTAQAAKALARFQELKRLERESTDRDHETYDDARAMRRLAASFHADIASTLLQHFTPQRDVLAEAHLRRALAIHPQEARASELLWNFLMQRSRWSDAREACEAMIRVWPDKAVYRANLGTLLIQLRDVPAAAAELERALTIDPSHILALHNLTRLYLETRQEPARALSFAQRLVQLQPSASHYDLLGWAAYVNHRLPEAREAAAKAVELSPTNQAYQERLRRLHVTTPP